MKGRERKRRITSCFMIVVLTCLMVLGSAQPLAASSLDDLNKRLREIQSGQSKVSNELSVLQKQIQGTEEAIVKLTEQIKDCENEVAAKDKAYNDAVDSVNEVQQRVDAKQAEVDERQAIIRTRARATYEEGSTSTLALLLQSGSFSDLLSRIEYLKCLDDKDKALVDDLQARQKELEDEKAILTAQMETAKTLKEEAVQAKNQLDQKNKELQEELAAYQKNEAQLIKELDALEKSSEEISNLIREQQSINEQSGQSAGNGTLTTFPIQAKGWSITSYYGSRLHPIKKVWKMHTGVDIAIGANTPVVAAGGGKVIVAAYDAGGYGYYVIVDHGNNLSTLYAHMQALDIKVGTAVNAGQQIGRVGTSGSSTGYHLHFETRKNGNHTNPKDFFPGYI